MLSKIGYLLKTYPPYSKMAKFTNSDLSKLDLTPGQTEVLVKHLNAWVNRLSNNFYPDMNTAFKKLIYSIWSSAELKQFMTLPLSEALLDVLLDYEWVSGQLYYDYIPHELNAWAAKKFSL